MSRKYPNKNKNNGNNNRSEVSANADEIKSSGNRNSRTTRNGKSTINKGKQLPNGMALTNDPAWWSQDPNLLADAIATSTDFTGTVIELATRKDGPSHWFAAPGFLSYELYPNFGINKGPDDPLNMGTRQYYAFLRNRKRATKYDAVDLTCYTLALGEIRSFLVFLKRAFALKNLNKVENRYLYDDLLKSMYLDPDAWRKESFRFVSRWSTMQLCLNPYLHPDLAYYDLKDATYRYIYTETPGSYSDQMHIMNPAGFYCLSHDEDGATSLTFKEWALDGYYRDIDAAFDFLKEMVDAVMNDQSFMAMSADILDSLSPAELKPWNFQLDDITLDSIFVYDPVYLYRFKNMPVSGDTLFDTDVKQDPTKGFLVSCPKVVIGSSGANYFLEDRKLITTPEWNPSVPMLTEFTMFTPACRPDPSGATGTYEVSSGFYFCTTVWCITTQRDGTREWIKVSETRKADDVTLKLLLQLRPFKYCPRIMFHLAGNDGQYGDSSFVMDYVDSDAICVMENRNLMRLHNAVMMNAFSVQLNNLQTDATVKAVPMNSTTNRGSGNRAK